jgi:hypothetical protein
MRKSGGSIRLDFPQSTTVREADQGVCETDNQFASVEMIDAVVPCSLPLTSIVAES